ncbi:MAG: CusA/CzcA family heavy metal efflux RND transporter [Syntrophobacterales bacterium]|jgi:cobalt-zinc-cadmium resistance protein CzcA|nr:CusA/CzcA family heavy metal efflux RND transporter [Syntrophobacterales bacterium]
MIRAVVDFALNRRYIVLAFALLLFVTGIFAFKRLPVEAYPDVANNYAWVITQWPGRAAEEVEQQITVPIENAMNGIPHITHLRSVSVAGLSVVILVFDDDSDNVWNRQRVLERISIANLSPSLQPEIGPDFSPVGQIYFYTLRSTNPSYDAMELKSLQDWVLVKQFKTVPNVVDVSVFGGPTMEYQVRVDPDKLISYGLNIGQVEQQLTNNNMNAGGSFIEAGMQQINVRVVGLVRTVQDIEDTVIAAKNGTPVRVKDIATVSQGPKIRLGQFGRAIHREDGKIIDNGDVVSGIILMRKGAEFDSTLEGVHKKVKELNEKILPPGVQVVPFNDRSDLVHHTTQTVLKNLTEGFILVTIVLLIFLGSPRGALIVALTIPFSLLFASICLNLRNIPANLLSLGALDFGMVVDGAVVMVENIIRHLGSKESTATVPDRIRAAAHEVQRPVFYAIAIIISGYLPVFTLQHVEGRLFKPMAWTVGFALLGAMIFSITIAPVLVSLIFRKVTPEWHNPVVVWLTKHYRTALTWSIHHRAVMVAISMFILCGSIFLVKSGVIGSEFLPHLDEGSIWVRGTLAPSTGPSEGIRVADKVRVILASFPEVTRTTSQVGRPDDGMDFTGFFNTEYCVNLKPKNEWRPVFDQDKEKLIAAMNRELQKIPGAIWNFSQPIQDNMEEAVSGVKGQLVTKIYGDDLKILETKAEEIVETMRHINGVHDLGIFRVVGQPNLNFEVDRVQAARYQINVADVQDAIQTAVGGGAITQVLKGEQRYDLVMRYQSSYRDTKEAIERVRLLAPSGERVSLAQLCKVETRDGASQIYREGNRRYIAVKYSVRSRDLGSTVEEAIENVGRHVKLPQGYYINWMGEYESQKRAERRLLVVVPLTICLIFIIIYGAFGSAKWAFLNLINVVVAPIGGLMALLVTGTHFSVSSGVGFLALFGVSVQIGVIMVEYINQLRARGYSVTEAAIEGATRRLRPIMMTMLVATLGLLPAAMSHAIGSDSQRPFAIVIVGGLIADMLMSIFLLPTFYVWWARPTDRLPRAEETMDIELVD